MAPLHSSSTATRRLYFLQLAPLLAVSTRRLCEKTQSRHARNYHLAREIPVAGGLTFLRRSPRQQWEGNLTLRSEKPRIFLPPLLPGIFLPPLLPGYSRNFHVPADAYFIGPSRRSSTRIGFLASSMPTVPTMTQPSSPLRRCNSKPRNQSSGGARKFAGGSSIHRCL